MQSGSLLLPRLDRERLPQVLVPGPGGLDQLRLQLLPVDLRLRQGRVHPQHEVQSGEGGLADPGGVVQGGGLEGPLQDVGDLEPDRGGVPVTGQVDQAGDVAAISVIAQEQARPPALLHVHHGPRDGGEVLDRDVEQLVARVGLHDLHQVLARVALLGEAGAGEDLGHLAIHQRDPADTVGVGAGGEQPEEAPLTDHLAGGVEGLHPDVVQIDRAVHGGPGVGLGHHEQGLLPRLGSGLGVQPVVARARGLVVPQDAQTGAGLGHQGVVSVPLGEAVLAVAEEGEVALGQPGQQPPRLGDLLEVDARRRGVQDLLPDLDDPGLHHGPVLDRHPDVVQHPAEPGGDLLQAGRHGLPVDLDVDPGLDQAVVRAVPGAPGPDAEVHHLVQLTGHRATDHHQRVHDQVDAAAQAVQLADHRVDQEGHVVGDDLDHRVPGRPGVLLDGRGERTHVCGALRPDGRDLAVGQRCPGQIDRVPGAHLLHRHVAVVAGQKVLQLEEFLARALPLTRLGSTNDDGDPLVLEHPVSLGSHGCSASCMRAPLRARRRLDCTHGEVREQGLATCDAPAAGPRLESPPCA